MRCRFDPALAIPILIFAWIPASHQDVDIVGSWRGTALCVDRVRFPACKDVLRSAEVADH